MKKFIKMIPAALALVALASCSNDDFLGENGLDSLDGKTVLKVTTNEGVTRANAYGEDAITVFGTGDVIRVYDGKLQKYDSFKFATDEDGDSYFVVADEAHRNVAKGDAQFALFGAEGQISYAGWNNGKNVALLQIKSPAATYDEGATNGDIVTYKSALPLWGPVSQVSGQKYEFETPLARLTGYAAITFTNGKYGKVTAVRARSMKYVPGKTKADYKPYKGYIIKKETDKWKVIKADGTTVITDDESNFVTAEGAQAMSGWFDAVLETDGYLTKTDAPVADTQDPNIVEVKVDIENNPMKDFTNIVYLPIVPGTYDLLSFEYQIEGETDTWHVLGAAADFTAKRTSKLSFNQGFAADLGDLVPEQLSDILADDANINADLIYNINKLSINANDYHARYEVKVPNMKAKSVTLNIKELNNTVEQDAANTSLAQRLYFINADDNTPYEGTVTVNVAGVTSGTKDNLPVINLPKTNVVLAGDFSTIKNIDIRAAKSMKFGDGKTVSTFENDITTAQTSSYITTISDSIVVAEKATIGKAFTLAGANTGKNAPYQINVHGTTKAIVARFADVNVTGKGVIGGTLYAKGNVTVESVQNTAIVKLQFEGTGKTLDLKAGGIAEITTTDETTGRTLTIKNVETGASQIGSITDGKVGETKVLTITFEKSVWAGKKTTSTSLKNPANIYTASQLASLENKPTSGSYKLMTNIDLNCAAEGVNWTALPKLEVEFDGNGKTIENADAALFDELAANVKNIKKLTVAIDKKANTIGGLANKTGDENVTIEGVTVEGTIKAQNKVGGLIGATGTGRVSIGSGSANGGVSVNVTFTNNTNYPGTMALNANAGTFGQFIGQAGTGQVYISSNSNAANVDRNALYFHYNRILDEEGVITHVFKGNGNFIGYSPEATSLTYGKPSKIYTNAWTTESGSGKLAYDASKKKLTGKLYYIGTGVTNGTPTAGAYYGLNTATKSSIVSTLLSGTTVDPKADWSAVEINVHNLFVPAE